MKFYWAERGALQARLKSYDDISDISKIIDGLISIRRLARKHNRLAEMDCNGEGVIRGVHYYSGGIDDYAKRTYGNGVKSAYTTTDPNKTIFEIEGEKVEGKIKKICESVGFDVEFQGDPRGYTTKLSYHGTNITDIMQGDF